MELQLIPLTPAIDQLPVPVGVTPVDKPATVAVNVNVDPNATVDALVIMLTLGVSLVIVRLNRVLGIALV